MPPRILRHHGPMGERMVRIGVRVLIVATGLLAAIIAVLAFQPAVEVRYPDEVVTYDAGGLFIAVVVLATAAPGLIVWRHPRSWLLWSWTLIALVTSIISLAFADDVQRHPAGILFWTAGATWTLSWVLAAVATLGTLLAGFASKAAAVTYDHEAPVLAARLRRFVVVIAVLGLVLLGVGLLPGQEVYDDANDCLGGAIASLGMTEHHHAACSASYTQLRETRLAGGLPLVIYVVLLLAPALVLYRDPRARRAWWWVVWGAGGLLVAAALVLLLEFHLDIFSQTRTLWPTRVVQGGVAAMQALMLVALPITIVRSREPRLPVARATKAPPAGPALRP